MTMKQLASLAGVSVSTVSKAFSSNHEIPEGTRQRIFEIAKKQGCYEKYCKTPFAKKVIAVICPEFHSGNYSQQLAALRKEIEKRSAVMIAGSSEFNEDSTNELVSYFTENAKVDGIIVIDNIKQKTIHSVPIVVIGDSEIYDSIALSMKSAINDAVESLIQSGHKQIAFVGEQLTKSKCRNFIQAMEKSGIRVDYDYIVESDCRFEEAGYDGMKKIFSKGKIPTAVVAAYDNIAMGAMKCIREYGLKIPEDISVIGMDDNREVAYLEVPMTSITPYYEDLSEIAVDLLFEKIENKNSDKNKTIRVSAELVKRESTGKAKL